MLPLEVLIDELTFFPSGNPAIIISCSNETSSFDTEKSLLGLIFALIGFAIVYYNKS